MTIMKKPKKPKHLICRCGSTKKGWDLMCKTCWQKIPSSLRRALAGAVTSENRRAAVRAILDHRNQKPATDPRCPGDWD